MSRDAHDDRSLDEACSDHGACSAPDSSTALLDHLARLARAGTEAALAERGLRSRHLVALTLLRQTGPTTQQALASALAIDRTNLVGLLNEIEAAGLLERRRSEEDRRRHIVALTPRGERALAEAEAALAETEERLLAGLSAEERRTLHVLLARAAGGHADCAAAAGLRGAAAGAAG